MQSELEDARAIARQIVARHVLVEGHETEDPHYLANSPRRCYYCKTETFDLAVEFAAREGLAAVVDGTNADDAGDHRPGRQAAREHGVRSPLFEAGLTKAEIRALSRRARLPSWDKPALACLSSRVPYGTPISVEVLSRVERAEAAVRALGVRQLRVRHHGDLARSFGPPPTMALHTIGYGAGRYDLVGPLPTRADSVGQRLAPRHQPREQQKGAGWAPIYNPPTRG